ncbi:trans-sialidase, putative [Trypanosoma cruzi marinkellei]|uniref:Trans-sialidase, putative n=1 Tax=Trypanosoma cruzi marinkellei TaxID=85056 RepID=K2M708_TRYCR|nr:trans-sialidase, putative [Trypanosoma cruzi marinkellei]
MHSRVAAVKGPRTHNRRRVTGSSGRRREGRESERQRPNMSRRVFTSAVLLPLLIVMMCCGSGTVAADEQSTASKFEWKGIKDGDGVTVESLGVPGLLKVESDVFAVAEAQCKKSAEGGTFTGIASQLITTSTANAPEEVLKPPKDKTQVLEEDGSEDAKKLDVSRPTTVVEGNDIYMLVGKYSPTAAGQKSGAGDLGFLLVKGEVSDEGDSGRRIQWKNNTDVSRVSFDEQTELWTQLIGGGGSGVHTKDGTLLFPVEGTKKKSEAQNEEKAVSLLIYSSKDTKKSWTLSNGTSADGCSDPSVVEWGKDKKLIMMTACNDGRRRVYESGDKGESWTEALGTLSRVWGNKPGGEAKAVGSGFITATIDGDEDQRNVMLVTLPVTAEKDDKGGNEGGKLRLWLTDNTHIVDIGRVSSDEDNVAASSLLYKSGGTNNDNNEKLIALYEKKGNGGTSHSIWSVLLTEQLQRVKDVLATWKKVDGIVSKLCPSNAEKDVPTANECSPDKITAGLVGFLSGNFSENTWMDEYLGVNATVNTGTKDDGSENGVTFTGPGAGAEWPVGRQGENQLYHFANYNFTLVATVSIDGDPKEGSPVHLMGVKINNTDDTENTVLLGLSYNSEKKWLLSCGGEAPKDISSTLKPETTHHVAIVLRNGTQGSAYVNGQPVVDEKCELKTTGLKDKKVSHFYIGGDGSNTGIQEGVSVTVTVTNVLLYNRPLDEAEITALNAKLSISKPTVVTPLLGVTHSHELTEPVVQETAPPNIIDGHQQTATKSLKTSKDAGIGDVSAPAVSTVTTPLGEKDSVNPSAPGTSPGGHTNVGGDTVQVDGSPQSPVANVNAADTNAPTTKGALQGGPEVAHEVGARTGGNEDATGTTNGQEEQPIDSQDRDVNATAINSSLGNLSQGNNTDGGTVCGSGILPSLLLLLGLWGFAAL